MTITFQEESYKAFFTPEFNELLKAHGAETGGFNKKIKFGLDWDLYREAGRQHKFVVFTARDGESLIGYTVFFITKHPHYRTTTVADNDGLYLIPSYRKGYTGYNLIKYSIEELKKRVAIITLRSKAAHSFEIVAKRLKFKLLDHTFCLEV